MQLSLMDRTRQRRYYWNGIDKTMRTKASIEAKTARTSRARKGNFLEIEKEAIA